MGYYDGQPTVQPLIDEIGCRVRQENSENSATLLDVSELFAIQPPRANLDTRFTPCCMLRLYANLLPQLPERLLYLDNDVLCRRSFREFYYQDIQNDEVAGVLDHYGKWFFRNNPFRMDYINSGVLLLSMEEIRKTGLLRNCRQRCAEKKMFMPDQSALNKLCVSKSCCPGAITSSASSIMIRYSSTLPPAFGSSLISTPYGSSLGRLKECTMYCMTVTYRKRRLGRRPKAAVYVDGSFYPDTSLCPKARAAQLRDLVYGCMKDRSQNSNYDYIRYEPAK